MMPPGRRYDGRADRRNAVLRDDPGALSAPPAPVGSYGFTCQPASRMPPRPRPAIELRSSQLPSRTPIVPSAVTTPTGTALIFLVSRAGPLPPVFGAAAGAAEGACCVSVGAAATSTGVLLEPVSVDDPLDGATAAVSLPVKPELLPSPPTEPLEGEDELSPPPAESVCPRRAARETVSPKT